MANRAARVRSMLPACNNLKQARATSYQLSDREKMYCLIAEKCLELKLKDARRSVLKSIKQLLCFLTELL
eukprot:scaffold793_cov104-Skeletonema_dohrnii-CCMP3373.AAC.2